MSKEDLGQELEGLETPEARGSMPNGSDPVGARDGSAGKPHRPFNILDVLLWPIRAVLRLFFPKLVDRYVMGELVTPFLFGWALFLIIYVFAIHLFKLAKLVAQGARPSVVGEMIWLQTLLSSVTCLPMAMLLAALLAFGRLSGDSELVATQAGGISNLRPIRNAFILALALSLIGVAMNEFVLPPAGARMQHLTENIKIELKGKIIEALQDKDKATVIQDFEGGRLSRLVAARRLEPENPPHPAVLRDVTYIQYNRGRVTMIVQASRAEYLGSLPDQPGKRFWNFYDGRYQLMAQVTDGHHMHGPFLKQEFELNKSPDQVKRDQKEANQMSYRELQAYIAELKQSGVRARTIRELDVELERKLSVPFAALVLGLIGAPLGIRRQRQAGGLGVGVGVSLLIIVFYYIGMSFFGVLGDSGEMGPVEAAWACNFIGLGVGLFLTWRASR